MLSLFCVCIDFIHLYVVICFIHKGHFMLYWLLFCYVVFLRFLLLLLLFYTEQGIVFLCCFLF